MGGMSPRPIRVAFVIDDLGYAGAQKQLTILAEALRPRVQPEVHSLSEKVRPYADVLTENGVEVHAYSRIPGLNVLRLIQLIKTLRRRGVDIVHGFLDAADVYAFYAARALNVPALLSLRTDRMRLTGLRAGVLRSCLRRAAYVTVNSKAAARHAIDSIGVSPNNLIVIPNAYPESAIGTPRPPGGLPVVGYVGRFQAYKRIDLLIDAFAIVAGNNPDARLVLVGDGEDAPRLRQRAQSLGERVVFTGAVDDAPQRMRNFSCLVIMSLSEGLSNAAMEALAAGVPVIACPTGDLADLIHDGETGRLVRDDSTSGLARLIEEVLGDTELAAAVGEKGPRLLRERYTPRQAAEAILPAYERLVQK